MLAYGWLAVVRHSRFNSTGFDLAINEQVLWNTLNGRLLATSLEVDNAFADHFRPFLLAVLPAHALFQTPETRPVLQTILGATAAIPFYLLARYKLENEIIAVDESQRPEANPSDGQYLASITAGNAAIFPS